MKSKKIILFILAAILALITAFLIWNIFLKPQPQKEIIPVVEQESALSPVNRDEVKKPEESIQEDYGKRFTERDGAVSDIFFVPESYKLIRSGSEELNRPPKLEQLIKHNDILEDRFFFMCI